MSREARPSWDEWGLNLARAVATRADCTRRQCGAVIVDETHTVIATGYNGAPSGAPGCLSDGACPRGRHYQSHFGVDIQLCGCGNNWPCPDAVTPVTTSYDTGPGACIAVHAEANALLRAGTKARGATIYMVPGEPCAGCQRLIEGAGIARVVHGD